MLELKYDNHPIIFAVKYMLSESYKTSKKTVDDAIPDRIISSCSIYINFC